MGELKTLDVHSATIYPSHKAGVIGGPPRRAGSAFTTGWGGNGVGIASTRLMINEVDARQGPGDAVSQVDANAKSKTSHPFWAPLRSVYLTAALIELIVSGFTLMFVFSPLKMNSG